MPGELRQAFQRELVDGVRVATRVRLITLGLIAVLVILRAGPGSSFYLPILAGLAGLGLAQGVVSRYPGRRYRAVQAILIFADMALLAFALTASPPGAGPDWPVTMQLRLGNFDFFYVLLAFSVLSYSWSLALWTGIAAALAWSIAVVLVFQTDGAYTLYPWDITDMDVEAIKAGLLDENYVSIVILVQEIALALIVAAILTLAVWRARRLALAQVRASAERASLARYFSPAVVDELVQSRSSIAEVRSLDAAVLFADIVGFTPLAEQLPPEEVIAMLRDFHQRLAKAVFDHGGTVNKYIGDAIMASFGAPRPIDQAALRAVRCAQAMVASIDTWNVQRRRRGDSEMMIAVGLHYGTVVIGDIGDERCLEFAMVGDTVNVASRLEGLCRELQASATISDDIITRARLELPEIHEEFDAFEQAGAHRLKGRSEPIAVHVIPRSSR